MKIPNRSTDVCVNCAQPFSPINIKVDLVPCPILSEHEKLKFETTSVGSVLTSIYNLKENNETEFDSATATCCVHCASVLSRLYQIYVEFNQLRQLESVLARAIVENNNILGTIVVIDRPTNEEGQNRNTKEGEEGQSRIEGDPNTLLKNNILSPHNQNDGVDESSSQSIDIHHPDLDSDQGSKSSSSLQEVKLGPWVELEKLTPDELKRAGVVAKDQTTTTTNKNQIHSRKTRKLNKICPGPQLPLETPSLDLKEESEDNDDSDFDPDDFQNHDNDDDDDDFKLEPEDLEEFNRSDPDLKMLPTSKKKINLKTIYTSDSAKDAEEGHSEKRVSCPICSKSLATHYGLKMHLVVQHDKKPFSCASCDLSFPSRLELKTHREVHPEPVGECQKCGKVFRTLKKLRAHSIRHYKGLYNCCSLCSKRFADFDQLIEHHNTVHPAQPMPVQFKCSQCPMSFSKKSPLASHIRRSHPAGPRPSYSCDICGKFFGGRRASLKIHMDIHVRRYNCRYCQLTFPNQQEQQVHLQTNHRKKAETRKKEAETHNCSECGKTFRKSLIRLKDHYTYVHSICTICWKKCGNSDDLNEHFASVHPGQCSAIEFNFKCSQCPKSFQKNGYLASHIRRSHPPGPRPSDSCHICGKFFGGKKCQLQRHLDSHAGVREHLCPHCGLTFRRHQTLQSHLLIHTNEKPHECKTCHKFFRHLHGLRVHEEAHNEGHSYLCSECGKSFQKRVYLRNHLKVHRDHRPYACEVSGCGRAFKTSAHLKKHADVHVDFRTKRMGRGLARKKSE